MKECTSFWVVEDVVQQCNVELSNRIIVAKRCFNLCFLSSLDTPYWTPKNVSLLVHITCRMHQGNTWWYVPPAVVYICHVYSPNRRKFPFLLVVCVMASWNRWPAFFRRCTAAPWLTNDLTLTVMLSVRFDCQSLQVWRSWAPPPRVRMNYVHSCS